MDMTLRKTRIIIGLLLFAYMQWLAYCAYTGADPAILQSTYNHQGYKEFDRDVINFLVSRLDAAGAAILLSISGLVGFFLTYKGKIE